MYVDTVFRFYGSFFFNCLVGLFRYLLFGASYMHVFCIFVFAPVQCNCACFTWKGALEIRSLLLLSLLLISVFSRRTSRQFNSSCSLTKQAQADLRFLTQSLPTAMRKCTIISTETLTTSQLLLSFLLSFLAPFLVSFLLLSL